MAAQDIIIEPSGNSFIDENHQNLLEHLTEISALISNSFNPDKFRSIIEDFIINLEHHFSHEETILRGVGYKNLRIHTLQHRTIALELHKHLVGRFSYNETIPLVNKIKKSIFVHELSLDQDYWPYFNDNPSGKVNLITWRPEFETGRAEADRQHQSLINHVNRFYIKVIDSNDIGMACSELKLLSAYSEHHFQEEEQLLGDRLRLGHKEHHQKLLADLGIVINEIRDGKFKLTNLGDYLDFWLLNHIKMYDIPAFASN
jgi:hemerythrin